MAIVNGTSSFKPLFQENGDTVIHSQPVWTGNDLVKRPGPISPVSLLALLSIFFIVNILQKSLQELTSSKPVILSSRSPPFSPDAPQPITTPLIRVRRELPNRHEDKKEIKPNKPESSFTTNRETIDTSGSSERQSRQVKSRFGMTNQADLWWDKSSLEATPVLINDVEPISNIALNPGWSNPEDQFSWRGNYRPQNTRGAIKKVEKNAMRNPQVVPERKKDKFKDKDKDKDKDKNKNKNKNKYPPTLEGILWKSINRFLGVFMKYFTVIKKKYLTIF